MKTIRQAVADEFVLVLELAVLLFVFGFGALMLAWTKQYDEMARWIEGGAVVGILARALTGKGGSNVNDNGSRNTEITNQKPE